MELLTHPVELLMVFLVIFAFIYGSLLLDDWLESKKVFSLMHRAAQKPRQEEGLPIQNS